MDFTLRKEANLSNDSAEQLLAELHALSEHILLSVVLTSDGLEVLHLGDVGDADHYAAYLLELRIVSQKILAEFKLDEVEEIYIRSRSGCVTMLPIFEKGYLACLSSPALGAPKLMFLANKYAKKLYDHL